MKISFVIPVYKKPMAVLKRCIKSLFDMSHKEIEVICAFDGSDPVLESYVDSLPEIKKVVIDHAGAGAARNAGFRESTGEIVCFWDADCYAEPGMAKVWRMLFDNNPDADFIFSGYKWTREDVPGFDPEPVLDPWLLKKYNFLHSMNPIKRDKVVAWDEKLEGLQDWDFWRRVVDGGAKGILNQGYGFSTEYPDKDSISGKGVEEKVRRIEAIRTKFNDPHPEVMVLGLKHKIEAVRIAKLLEADYFYNTDYYFVRDYKMILAFGFNAEEMEIVAGVFARSKQGTIRAIYWTGMDAEKIQYGPYSDVKRLVGKLNESVHIHLCQDSRSKDILESIGIKAEVLAVPRPQGALFESLPEKFKVLAFGDNHYSLHIDSIVKSLPDVHFDQVKEETFYDLKDYSVVMRFVSDPRLGDPDRIALIQGRYMISNVEAPYAGYVDTTDVKRMKNTVINKIREFQKFKEINRKARDFYLADTEPEKFSLKIKSLILQEAK